jgi:hypothetical protein
MPRQLSLSLSTTSALAVGYNIQLTAISASSMLAFSLPVSTTILDLIILEFIFGQQN